MSDKKITKMDVVIAGEIVTLKSTEDADHLHRIARYVDQQIAEISAASKSTLMDERVRTLLIALNIADDCFKKMDNFRDTEKTSRKLQKELAKAQNENALLQQKIKELQSELANTRDELEDFIENFDEDEDETSDKILTLPIHDSRKVVR